MISPMIVTDELTKRYPVKVSRWKRLVGRKGKPREDSILAVDRLRLEVKKGEVFGFLGPNGAGKTTTIKMLIGLMPPTSGTARVAGHDVERDKVEVQACVGYMPESRSFYSRISVERTLGYYSRLYSISKHESTARIAECLETVGLTGERGKPCGKLSFGMRKRLSLAQALLHEPELLILDEPTGGLDPQGKRDFQDLLRTLSGDGITIFMSSHLLGEMQKICSNVGIINSGRLIADGSLSDLQRRLSKKAKVRIAIRVRSPASVPLEEIRARPEVADATLRTDILTIMAHDEDVSSEINRLLVSRNCQVRSMVIEEPELEDIFFDITS